MEFWISYFISVYEIIKLSCIVPSAKRKFAVIISHDVDSDYIFKNKDVFDRFVNTEEKNGVRSAWYFVTNKYKIDHSILHGLLLNGHEIGFHGDNHDYRLPFLKREKMEKRLDRCIPFIKKYKVTGGRSPVFLRSPLFLDVLGNYLQYDTSFHDSTIGGLSGKNEGCCSCFPFFINSLLEIPTTIPEEFILSAKGFNYSEIIDIQLKKLEKIREIGGVVHILTHPEPNISATRENMKIYTEFLAICSKYNDAWFSLPSELNNHWRERDKLIVKLLKEE